VVAGRKLWRLGLHPHSPRNSRTERSEDKQPCGVSESVVKLTRGEVIVIVALIHLILLLTPYRILRS